MDTNQIIKQAQGEVKHLLKVYGDALYQEWFDEPREMIIHKDAVMESIDSRISQAITQAVEEEEKEEIKFLKRMNLEFEVVACDCGEPYKDTDPHNYIKERLDKLTK